MPVPSKKWKKAEVEVIKAFGGRPNLNSGATWHQKGDGRIGRWCLEVKSTGKETFSVTPKIIGKLEKDASAMGRDPLLIVNFASERRQVCLVPEDCVDIPEGPFEAGNRVIDAWTEPCHMVFGNRRYLVLGGVMAKIRIKLE